MGSSIHTLVRDLHRPRGRERRGFALAEGVRLVEEALAAGVPVEAAVVSPALEATSRGRALKTALAAATGRLLETTDAELGGLAATEQPQGVIAALAIRPAALDQIAIGPRNVVVVLDALQDPGNVGTIVRTAHGLGAAGVIALPGTAELTNPKTLRATMGSLFHLPVVSAGETAVAEWLAAKGIHTATAAAGAPPFAPDRLPRPLAIVLGNEGAGARSALGAGAASRIGIPLVAAAESLNVAVTAGIILYGVCRE